MQNFKTNQVWFIDRQRLIVHEVPLIEVGDSAPVGWCIVVREERFDGSIDELRRIESANFSENHFFPSEKLRKTDLRELMLGTPEIGGYSEELDTN